jgi:hypothetical protein
MRIGDALYFSPNIRFADLIPEDVPKLVNAFQDRVNGFYLAPASRLLNTGDFFAAGLICFSAVEFIATVTTNQHPTKWLQSNLEAFKGNEELAGTFWNQFRHGLSHEGRIKNFGQFSTDFPDMLTHANVILIVNPGLFFEAINSAFTQYMETLDESQTAFLEKSLLRFFKAELDTAKE